MPITNSRQLAAAVYFDTPKCKAVVPGHDHLLRCAIEQASLDASVRSISQCAVANELLQRLSPNGIVLNRVDGKFLLVVFEQLQQRTDVEGARLEEALSSNSLQLLERDAVDIHTEPLFSNTLTVWSHERYHVSLLDRLRFAAALAENGPLSVTELEMCALPGCDTLAAVCALACADLVQLELHEAPIGPHTIVSEAKREQW